MKKLPLTSANWWELARTLHYCRAQLGNRELAAYEFRVAVNDGRLRTKIEQFSRKNPTRRKSWLLTPELRRDHALEPYYYNAWILRPRTADISPITPPYAFFFWAPDVKKIWPEQAREPEPPKPDARPRWARDVDWARSAMHWTQSTKRKKKNEK